MNLQQVLVNARNRGNLDSVVDVLRGAGVEGIEAALKASGQMPPGWWTRERCLESARGYKTRGDWWRSTGGAWDAARRNRWLDECCKHMVTLVRDLNKEFCMLSASGHKTRSAWIKADSSAYTAARKRKWLDDCCKHMRRARGNRRIWDGEDRGYKSTKP